MGNSIHFAYLFASPLVLNIEGEEFEDVLNPISFQDEFQAIINGLENDGVHLRYRYQMATLDNLVDSLR